MSNFNITLFPERLFELVDASELPLKDIAANIGVSPHMLERFMRGKALPKSKAICNMCELFHVRADYILGRSEEKYKKTGNA